MLAAEELSGELGTRPACDAMGFPRSTLYRRRSPVQPAVEAKPKRNPGAVRALSAEERASALALLHSERFVDMAPASVVATLLDEGRYLCSTRTLYRILDAAGEVRERRNQARHPKHAKPQLCATAPNQVWSWDITKLLGPAKWTYFYLYVVIDIFSRMVVAWMVASRESASLAKELLAAAYERQGVVPGQLTTHSDRGSAMRSKTVALLLADLGVTKSFSRPRVSNDNPYSESHFKTLKYRPGFPDRFGCLEDARSHCNSLFSWYNEQHRHSGLGYLTPSAVHHGQAEELQRRRAEVLLAAYERNPERFVNKTPVPPALPAESWINPLPKALAVGGTNPDQEEDA